MSGEEVRLIGNLSAAIASGQAVPSDVATAIGAKPMPHEAPMHSSDPGATLEIVKVPNSNQVWSVIVTFDTPFPLAVIESAFGSASPLPRSHPGGATRVRLALANSDITLIADIGVGGSVEAVTVQADSVDI